MGCGGVRGGPHFDPVVQAPSRKSINRVGVEKNRTWLLANALSSQVLLSKGG